MRSLRHRLSDAGRRVKCVRAVNKHIKYVAGIKKTRSETRPGFPFGTVNRGAADRILDNPPLKPARGGGTIRGAT